MGVPPRLESPAMRRALRVLRMVHELHKLGHQKLRVRCGMSPSGMNWRCTIFTPGKDPDLPVARYTSGMENRYFEWTDAEKDDAIELANKFIERFPDLVRNGEGRDWNYAGWFVEMLGFAEKGAFPIEYAEYHDESAPLAKDGVRELPNPPSPVT